MTAKSGPEVFGNGDVTIAVSGPHFRLYVGQVLVENVESISLECAGAGRPASLRVNMQIAITDQERLLVEEHVRLLQTLGWTVSVSR